MPYPPVSYRVGQPSLTWTGEAGSLCCSHYLASTQFVCILSGGADAPGSHIVAHALSHLEPAKVYVDTWPVDKGIDRRHGHGVTS